MRLNFTILRTLSEQRIVIPNERLASGILRNDTLETDAVGLDVSLWLPAGADVPRALDVLREETDQSVSVAEAGVEGTRLRWAANACHRPNAPSTRRSCASSACGGCARTACWRLTPA